MRIFTHQSDFCLENGAVLPQISLAYHTYGTLNADKSNVIWVVHALTANSDCADWWAGLFGAGKVLDPERYFIVCANNLGSCYGSTYAGSINPHTGEPYYHEFPLITSRDMAASLDLLRQYLGLPKIHLALGGSQGGQVLQEWAIAQPDVFEHLVLLATNAQHSAWGIAFNEAQRMAIAADSTWQERNLYAGREGLRAARAIALLSYRHYDTYRYAQTDTDTRLEGFKASSYQQYQGDKLARRFDAFAYWTLSKAMDAHHVGRGRASLEAALAGINAKTLVIGIHSDLLFPISEQQFLAQHIPRASYVEIASLYGHDGFLIEFEAIGTCIGQFLSAQPAYQPCY